MGLETVFERETGKRRGGEGKADRREKTEAGIKGPKGKSRSGSACNHGINISNGILN